MITADKLLIGCCFVSMAMGIGISLLLKGQAVIVGALLLPIGICSVLRNILRGGKGERTIKK